MKTITIGVYCCGAQIVNRRRTRPRSVRARHGSAPTFGEMKDALTPFQLEVEKGINDVLDHVGKHVVDRRIAGIAETYVTGSISDQDIVFWIYPDGAALQVGRRRQTFGFPKRQPRLDTAREFLDEFRKVLTGLDAAARN